MFVSKHEGEGGDVVVVERCGWGGRLMVERVWFIGKGMKEDLNGV